MALWYPWKTMFKLAYEQRGKLVKGALRKPKILVQPHSAYPTAPYHAVSL